MRFSSSRVLCDRWRIRWHSVPLESILRVPETEDPELEIQASSHSDNKVGTAVTSIAQNIQVMHPKLSPARTSKVTSGTTTECQIGNSAWTFKIVALSGQNWCCLGRSISMARLEWSCCWTKSPAPQGAVQC